MSFNIAKNTRVRTVNKQAAVTGTEYTLYQCPANCRAMMSLLFISNVSSSNATVDIEFNRADTTSNNGHMHILGSKNMSVGEFVQFSDGYIVFESGDTMTFTATGAGTIHVDAMATVEEYFIPVGG